MWKNILAIMTVAAGLCACSAMPAGPAAGGSVNVATEKLRVLMVDPDKAQLEALVADDLSYGHSGGKVDTKASFVGDLVSGASDFVSIDITDQVVKVTGNTATVRHTLTGKTIDGGKPGNVKLHILQVWQSQGGEWKLLARQAIRLPS
ncbi:MAG: nuclear transport factor 2 family protein [Polaromonas sp.]